MASTLSSTERGCGVCIGAHLPRLYPRRRFPARRFRDFPRPDPDRHRKSVPTSSHFALPHSSCKLDPSEAFLSLLESCAGYRCVGPLGVHLRQRDGSLAQRNSSRRMAYLGRGLPWQEFCGTAVHTGGITSLQRCIYSDASSGQFLVSSVLPFRRRRDGGLRARIPVERVITPTVGSRGRGSVCIWLHRLLRHLSHAEFRLQRLGTFARAVGYILRSICCRSMRGGRDRGSERHRQSLC